MHQLTRAANKYMNKTVNLVSNFSRISDSVYSNHYCT